MASPRGYTPYTGIHELYGRNPEHSYFDNRMSLSKTPSTEGGNGKKDNPFQNILDKLDPIAQRQQQIQNPHTRFQDHDQGGDGFGDTGGGFATPGDTDVGGPVAGLGAALGTMGKAASSVTSPFGLASMMHAMAENPDELASPTEAMMSLANNVFGLNVPTSLSQVANMGLNAIGFGQGTPGGLGDPGMGQGMIGSSAPGMTSGIGGEGMGPAAGGPGASGGVGGGAGPSGSSGPGGPGGDGAPGGGR